MVCATNMSFYKDVKGVLVKMTFFCPVAYKKLEFENHPETRYSENCELK